MYVPHSHSCKRRGSYSLPWGFGVVTSFNPYPENWVLTTLTYRTYNSLIELAGEGVMILTSRSAMAGVTLNHCFYIWEFVRIFAKTLTHMMIISNWIFQIELRSLVERTCSCTVALNDWRNPSGSAFRIYPESSHFSPPPPPALWTECLLPCPGLRQFPFGIVPCGLLSVQL